MQLLQQLQHTEEIASIINSRSICLEDNLPKPCALCISEASAIQGIVAEADESCQQDILLRSRCPWARCAFLRYVCNVTHGQVWLGHFMLMSRQTSKDPALIGSRHQVCKQLQGHRLMDLS